MQHLQLTVMAVGIGLVLASVLAAVALRFRWTFAPITALHRLPLHDPERGPLRHPRHQASATPPRPRSRSRATRCSSWCGTSSPGSTACRRSVTDAADGLGLSRTRRLLTVELPLALPVIVTGHPGRHRDHRGPRRHHRDHPARRPRRADLRRLRHAVLHEDGRRIGAVRRCWRWSSTWLLHRRRGGAHPVGPAEGRPVIRAPRLADGSRPTSSSGSRDTAAARQRRGDPRPALAHGLALAPSPLVDRRRSSPCRSPRCWPTTAEASWLAVVRW